MRLTMIGVAAAVAALASMGPATAQTATAATPAEASAAGDFLATIVDRVFAELRGNDSKAAMKVKFRGLLKENFAIDEAGMRLIRRYRNQITPAQLAAYQAALPDYVINAYADRLVNYSAATVKVVRTQAHGSTGNVDVFTRITKPGKDPFEIIWLVSKGGGGRWLIANVTVSGVNLSLTQEADFSSYIANNGFDALIAMMKSANAKTA